MIAVDFLSHDFMKPNWHRELRIAQKILSPAEYAFWERRGRSPEDLFKYWLAKEATYKLAAKQNEIPRTFSPKALQIEWVSANKFSSQSDSYRYEGRWEKNSRGRLALINCRSDYSVKHLWAPYQDGRRVLPRQAFQDFLKAQNNSILARPSLSTNQKPVCCRSYSAPWALCSIAVQA